MSRRPGADGPGKTRCLLLVPLADPDQTATLCAMAGISADVVRLEGRGCAVLPRRAEGVLRGTRAVSRLLGSADVMLLMLEGSPSANGSPAAALTGVSEGQLTAERWRAGRCSPEPAPGLVLSGLPSWATRLLLGSAVPKDVAGATSTDGRRRDAARMATGALRNTVGRLLRRRPG